MIGRQQLGQQAVKVSVGTHDRLGADAFDNVERRDDDTSLAQIIEHLSWIDAKRLTDLLQHRSVGRSVHGQPLPWKAQPAKLHGEAQSVGGTPALANQS